MKNTLINELYQGFMRVHILYHAKQEPIYGAWLMEEIQHHGYDIGPGTLYPILHRMESSGLLESEYEIVEGKRRRYYHATDAGIEALEKAREHIVELVKEINEE